MAWDLRGAAIRRWCDAVDLRERPQVTRRGRASAEDVIEVVAVWDDAVPAEIVTRLARETFELAAAPFANRTLALFVSLTQDQVDGRFCGLHIVEYGAGSEARPA